MSETDERWECVVIGAGAAGLSAALVLGRARRRVLVLDSGDQSNRPAHGIGGLLGHDGRPPADLYARGREELAAYPTVDVRNASVVAGAATVANDPAEDPDGFVLTTADGTAIHADRVLLATGMRYALPDLPGIEALWGDTVFHCPYCRGWEARDGALAVLGNPAATHRALLLKGWSADVVLLTDGPAELDDHERPILSRARVPIIERPVQRLAAQDGRLSAVVFADGSELPRDGLMAVTPLVQRSDLAEQLGAALTERGTVDVDPFGRTTVAGLYAAGDASTMTPQVSIAIAEGALAAAAINGDVVAQQHGIPPVFPVRTTVEPAAAAAAAA